MVATGDGLVQRAELLDAIMADLYGARSLLASGTLPPSAIFDHDEYLRPVIGAAGISPRLFTSSLLILAGTPTASGR